MGRDRDGDINVFIDLFSFLFWDVVFTLPHVVGRAAIDGMLGTGFSGAFDGDWRRRHWDGFWMVGWVDLVCFLSIFVVLFWVYLGVIFGGISTLVFVGLPTYLVEGIFGDVVVDVVLRWWLNSIRSLVSWVPWMSVKCASEAGDVVFGVG